jgi:hypothetical protein
MYPKNPLFQKCLAYLESLPNMQATIQAEPYFSSEVLADGQLIINAADKTIHYVCEIKTGLTTDVIEQVAEYFTNLAGRLKDGQRPLLITSDLSDRVIEKLLEKNIEFIDVNGNAYLNSPNLYIVTRKQVSKDSINKSLEISSYDLRVMYVLLIEFHGSIEQISNLAEVSRRTARSTFQKLRALEYLTQWGTIIDYMKLLERWELGYTEKLRAKLLIENFSLAGNRSLAESVDEIQGCADTCGYLIGGELAASMMMSYLRPINATLHLNQDAEARQVAVKLKLKPDPEGNISFMRSFGHNDYQKNNLAHPLLVHAELVRTGNSRLKETAQLIYDRYLEPIAQSHDRS